MIETPGERPNGGERRARLRSRLLLLWAGIVMFLGGQAVNLVWHRSHTLERGAGPFHNPGATIAAVGFALVVVGAVMLSVLLRGPNRTSDRR